MGTEAGQPLETILRRKELERRVGGGVFAWGIGNSLGMAAKLAQQEAPQGGVDVFFTPMRSAAKQVDVEPGQVLLWLNYVNEEERQNSLPSHMVVTSRGSSTSTGNKRSHYALICNGDEDITSPVNKGAIDANRTRNFVSLNPLGASQVTAVVRYQANNSDLPEKLYPVTFRAKLHGAGFVRLVSPIVLDGELAKLYKQLCASTTAAEWSEGAVYLRRKAAEVEARLVGQHNLFEDSLV
jgi:hypothetical protein